MYLLVENRNCTCDNGNIEIYYLYFGWDICKITWWYIYWILYYYVELSNGSSIVQQLF